MMVWTKGERVSDWEGERMSLYNCQYVTLYLYKMIQMKKTMNNAKENHCCANLFVDSEGEKDKNYWLHAIILNVQNILILFAYA